VVCGISESWDHLTLINGGYEACSWSPCGQFLSTQASTSVEVWDSLTLEKQTTLQLPKSANTRDLSYLPSTLSYSPDGHFLAGFPGPAIAIWDIQTGGVVKEIECSDISTKPWSLVWSSDGQTIGVVFEVMETWVVCIYDISLGVMVSTGTLQSLCTPHLWSYNNSLQVMTMLADEGSQTIVNIFEIWPTFIDTPTKSFSIDLGFPFVGFDTILFSPAVYWISATNNHSMILVFDVQNSKVLLLERGDFGTAYFSPDGNLLAASRDGCDIDIWKYCSEDGYTLWMRVPSWGMPDDYQIDYYQFSPTSSSSLMLGVYDFGVKQLNSPRTTPNENRPRFCEQFSADGTYVVTVPHGGHVITITNLNGIYSQSIKPGFSVRGLALTKNVLLVCGYNQVVGWQLTEAGMVNQALGDEALDQDGRLWAVSVSRGYPHFWVGGCVGVIVSSVEQYFCYNTETGEELEPIPIQVPIYHVFPWRRFNDSPSDSLDEYSFSCHMFSVDDYLPGDSTSASTPWFEEGWVKYPQGKYQHKFWLPPYWRARCFIVYWLSDVTTLRFKMDHELVIIKFCPESLLS